MHGALEIELDEFRDHRGTFASTFSADAFADAGLVGQIAQIAVSFNPVAGTLRGLHLQAAPHGQAKLIRCTAGAIHDVLADLRPGSPTFGHCCSFVLTPRSGVIYVPEGVAHGFQTLEPETEVTYHFSRGRVPEAERGVRFDDPSFAFDWPLPVTAISNRDRTWPDWVLP